MSKGRDAVWPAYAAASIILAMFGGFFVGGTLFAIRAFGWPISVWWPAAAQAHGHIQLFGWAALMVLGVGFHFLPRLRGAADVDVRPARLALGLVVVGLVFRLFGQPTAAISSSGVQQALNLIVLASGVLEVAGLTLAIVVLVNVLRTGPPLRGRSGLWTVLPFFVSAFAGLWIASGLNAIGLAVAFARSSDFVPYWADIASIQIAFNVFLVPISVAMSVRTFAIYFRMPMPRLRLLEFGLLLLLASVVARLIGELSPANVLEALGRLGQSGAYGVFIAGLGIFGRRRPLPREKVRPLADPIQMLVVSAYTWLGLAGLLNLFAGLHGLGLTTLAGPVDAERHALGAGFVTLLILGMGSHLLPGFASRPIKSRGVLWIIFALGNLAALLRVVPVLSAGILPPPLTAALAASAGATAFIALLLFGINLPTGSMKTEPIANRPQAGQRV